jgi:hypothetical protein
MYNSRSNSRLKKIEAKLFPNNLSSWINVIENEEAVLSSSCPMVKYPTLSEEEKRNKAKEIQAKYGTIENYRNRPPTPLSPEIKELIDNMLNQRRIEYG